MKVNLTVPTSLDEITLGQYQKFILIKENSNDEDFINQKMIEIFCNIDLQNVAKMRMTDVMELTEHFNKMFNTTTPLVKTFKFEDKRWGFIPNLEDISLGEHIDLESNLADVKNIHKAMSVMFRPVKDSYKDRYTIEPYRGDEEYHELMKRLPLSYALPATVFFWNLGIELLRCSLAYLERETTEISKTILAKKLNLPNSGDGISIFINSLKEKLEDLIQLQRNHFTNA